MIGIGIYVKNSPKAIELYQAAFGLEMGYHVLNKDGTYFHSELHRRAFTLLAEGGRVELDICELPWSPCAAIVCDRYGVKWFLSLPQHKPADDWSPEEA